MQTASTPSTPFYGLMAEFPSSDSLARAASRAYHAGYRKMDAYSPIPIEGLAEAMGHTHKRVQQIVLIGGLTGMAVGFLLAWGASVILYPMNIGGRPPNSWPAFIVPTFETTILFAAFSAAIGMLALNGLPMPYHPVFNVESFRKKASSEGFFFCIEATDPKFDLIDTRRVLMSYGAVEVNEVAH